MGFRVGSWELIDTVAQEKLFSPGRKIESRHTYLYCYLLRRAPRNPSSNALRDLRGGRERVRLAAVRVVDDGGT